MDREITHATTAEAQRHRRPSIYEPLRGQRRPRSLLVGTRWRTSSATWSQLSWRLFILDEDGHKKASTSTGVLKTRQAGVTENRWSKRHQFVQLPSSAATTLGCTIIRRRYRQASQDRARRRAAATAGKTGDRACSARSWRHLVARRVCARLPRLISTPSLLSCTHVQRHRVTRRPKLPDDLVPESPRHGDINFTRMNRRLMVTEAHAIAQGYRSVIRCSGSAQSEALKTVAVTR